MWLDNQLEWCYTCIISIHTSHAGCDLPLRRRLRRPSHFNPHIPCGMWPKTRIYNLELFEFQSTHPMRDVTILAAQPLTPHLFQSTHPMRDVTKKMFAGNTVSQISIHTSHAGCDAVRTLPAAGNYNFNPHIPCGMWRQGIEKSMHSAAISIHTSHAGCDQTGMI